MEDAFPFRRLALGKSSGSVWRVRCFRSSVRADTVGTAKGRHEGGWRALGLYPRGRSRGERGVAWGTGQTAGRVQTRTSGAVRLLRAGHSSGAFLNGISVSEIHEEPSFTDGETEASRGSATGPGACWQHVPEPDPSACLSDSEVWASPPSWSSLSVAGREVCPSDSPEAERERAWGLQRSWSWVSLLGSTRSD